MDMKKFSKKFEQEAVKVMRDFKVPGMSIFVTKDGKTTYHRAFGIREKGDVKPATIDSLYGVSSITKSITCLAILQLHEAQKLNIHDPISKYVPVDLMFKDTPITVHHLMSHASGIPSLMTFYFSQMNQELYEPVLPKLPLGNWDDFYFHLNDAKTEVLSPPSKKYYYWNAGFTLLGQIVEKTSGQLFEEYINENILKPLEMKRSTFSKDDVERDDDVSKGFNFELKDKKVTRKPKNLLTDLFIAGAGGLISSVKEITNYLLCHLNKGDFNGKKLLSEELIKEMWKPHNKNLTSQYQEYCPGSISSYGYGFRVYDNYYGYTLVTHGGVSGVTGGQVAFIPELNLTFAQLYNVSWLPTHLMHTALALLLGKDPEKVMPYHIRKKHYKKLCGRYDAYKKTLTMEIKEKESILYLEGSWQEKFKLPLIPKNDDPEVMDFYVILPQGNMDVPFSKQDDGHITFDYERYLMHKKTIELEED